MNFADAIVKFGKSSLPVATLALATWLFSIDKKLEALCIIIIGVLWYFADIAIKQSLFQDNKYHGRGHNPYL